VKTKDAKATEVERIEETGVEEKTSVSQNRRATDEISSQQENVVSDEPQKTSELDEGQKLDDSGQQVASLQEDGEQLILNTQQVEEENVDQCTLKQEELQNLSESKESTTAETPAEKDGDQRIGKQTCCEREISQRDETERDASVEQHDVSDSESCEVKTEKLGEQRQDDDAQENVEPELTVKQQMYSRL